MRDDETGKRSLFGPPVGGGRVAPGARRATFRLITVDCSRCAAATRIGVLDALRRLARWGLWMPGRTYSRRIVCPACGRRSWVRLRLL